MIKDKLENIDKYSLNEFFEIFKAKVRNESKHPEHLEAPLQAIPLEYETKEFDLTKFENHQKNIDIHYIIDGSECIGINTTENIISNIPYNEEGDYQLFDGAIKEQIVLEKGDFLILFPGEAHITGGKVKKPGYIQKIVYKVPL